MTLVTIAVPKSADDVDPIDTIADFHDALRDVAVWARTIVDDDGRGSPRDARWLRAFLAGPLRWHLDDENEVLLPALAEAQGSRWLHAYLVRMIEHHARVLDAAARVASLVAPMAAGDVVAVEAWKSASAAFEHAVAAMTVSEGDVLLPTARLFLDADRRLEVLRALRVRDDARPWRVASVAGDVPVAHAVHSVRTTTSDGGHALRSFAACPRRRSVDVAHCIACPHFDDRRVDRRGRGHVACAIDDARAPDKTTVYDVMTRDVLCIARDAALDVACDVLADAHVSGMPVIDEAGRPVGVLSQTDVVAAIARGADVHALRVRDAMMHVPFVVRESDALDDAARLLLVEHVHRLPVVNHDGVVVGVISALDVVRAQLAASAEQSADRGADQGARSVGARGSMSK